MFFNTVRSFLMFSRFSFSMDGKVFFMKEGRTGVPSDPFPMTIALGVKRVERKGGVALSAKVEAATAPTELIAQRTVWKAE